MDPSKLDQVHKLVSQGVPVARACRMLGVSRSSYYRHRSRSVPGCGAKFCELFPTDSELHICFCASCLNQSSTGRPLRSRICDLSGTDEYSIPLWQVKLIACGLAGTIPCEIPSDCCPSRYVIPADGLEQLGRIFRLIQLLDVWEFKRPPSSVAK